MIERYYPGKYYDSAYHIAYEQLWKEGCRGIIFDIDNTLVPHDADGTARSSALMNYLKAIGFQVCLLSNNKEERVLRFNQTAKVSYIFNASKPSRKGYLAAAQKMGLSVEQCVFIGDQIFTDVWGANRVGMRSILVKPMHPKEILIIVLKRRIEQIIIRKYLKEHELLTGEDCITLAEPKTEDYKVEAGKARDHKAEVVKAEVHKA